MKGFEAWALPPGVLVMDEHGSTSAHGCLRRDKPPHEAATAHLLESVLQGQKEPRAGDRVEPADHFAQATASLAPRRIPSH